MKVLITLTLLIMTTQASHAATTTYSCVFPKYASPEGLKESPDNFKIDFLVDDEEKKSYVLGNNGSSEVTLVPNVYGLSFLEITDTGNLMVTAISSAGEAVHSRNGIILDKITPSQYYGSCSIK